MKLRFALLVVAVLSAGLSPARLLAARGKASEAPHPPTPAVYDFGALNATDSARLDREHCMLLQPIGILQTRGPHLPLDSDVEIATALARRTAEEFRKLQPDYSVVIMPTLPVGTAPLHQLGYIYGHPATNAISSEALRDFLLDWALDIGENAYWNYAFITWHHQPEYMRRLSEVADYYTQEYRMRTINASSLVLADSTWQAGALALGKSMLGDVPEADPTFEMDGGVAETSVMLAINPGALGDYKDMPDVGVSSYEGLLAQVSRYGWPGYVGFPSRADAEFGRRFLDLLAKEHARFLDILVRGGRLDSAPRLEDRQLEHYEMRDFVRRTNKWENEKRAGFRQWLEAHKGSDQFDSRR